MRTTPSVTSSNGTNLFYASSAGNSFYFNAIDLILQASPSSAFIRVSISGATVGDYAIAAAGGTTAGVFMASAEL